MTWMRCGIGAAAVAALLAAGCGDDDGYSAADLSGLYQVTHHTVNDSSCVEEGTDATDVPYIRLTDEDYQGTRYFALRRCQSTDPADCDDLDFFRGTSLTIPIQNGWQEIRTSAGYSIATNECMLQYGESTAVLQGDGVRVELRTWGEDDPGVDQALCLPELAMQRQRSMPCVEYEVIAGDRVQR